MCATIDIEHWNTQHLYTDNLLKKPWSCMDVLGISWIFHIYIASQQDSCWQRRSTWLCCLWLSRPFLRSALSVGLAGCAWCHQTKMDLFIPTETGMSMISKKKTAISMVSINKDRDFEVLIISISHQKTRFQWFQSTETGTSMISIDRK